MNGNSKDASSNFKIITEFGIFYILLFLSLLYIISKKISLENKIFLFPFFITQFIRGAGYFNIMFNINFIHIIINSIQV